MTDGTNGTTPTTTNGTTNGTTANTLRVVPLPVVPTTRKITDAHLANLRESGLSDETIELAELYTEDRPKVLAQLVQRRTWNRLQGAALVFPFYAPGATEVYAYRVRPTTPLTESGRNGKKRARKYDQASAAGLLTYYPPRARLGGAYTNAAAPLYWTEGEKKALVLDQEGLPCVGLTGVWNWIDSAHKEASGGEERLHPRIRDHVTVAGRAHVIVFDADARQNDKVMTAAQRLCAVLLAAGATAVRFVAPPDGEHKGIDDYYAAHGPTATRALLDTAADLEPADPKQPLSTVGKCAAYREAPIDQALRVPESYELQRDGSLWRNDDAREARVTHAPLFITRILVDHYAADERVDLAWYRAGQWHALCATRRAISDSRTLVAELAPYGAPVNSGNAAKLVEWFEAFEHANTALIPRVASVASTGWHSAPGGGRVFVTHAPIGPDPNAPPPFVLDTRGDRCKIFAALTPRGTLDGHVAALRRAWDASPVCAAVIAGALAAPLLEPLRAANFAIHLVGESSRGKTSQLKIGASVYGDPASPQWLASWNATLTGAELRAAILTDLPQCYDEIGGGDPQQAERMVYALINGGGRTRATRDMTVRETVSWRTIVMSTGERELADETTATGAQVRVLQLPVDGFGGLSAAQVDALRAECAAHAGAFGQAWLEMLASIDDWQAYRDTLAQVTAMLREAAADDPLQGRVAGYFGLLAMVEAMASESFGLGRGGHTFRELFAAVGKREAVQGIGERARDAVASWVLSEPDAFPEIGMSSTGEADEPKSNGVRTRHGFRRDGEVLIIPAEFRAFCKRSRLAPRAVIREWARLGWTELDAGRLDKQVRVGGHRYRFVVLTPTDTHELPDSLTGDGR